MRRASSWILALAVASLLSSVLGMAWWRGSFARFAGRNLVDLEEQLRDRGTVAVVGGVPFGLRHDLAPLRSAERDSALWQALQGNDGAAVVRALAAGHYDGVLVRLSGDAPAGSVLQTLRNLRPVRGLAAAWIDERSALYEPRPVPEVTAEQGRELLEVVRLMLQGASAPPERLFAEPLRRPAPTEVAVMLRDGGETILWRSVRGGSIARALVDATYAVADRWSTRQSQRYGELRDAVLRMPLTVAIFHDRGTLGTRTDAFLDRAGDAAYWSLGYEYNGRWEYLLPTMPGQHTERPSQALALLAREHDVPTPGLRRPEVLLYRFHALQLSERTAQGEVQLLDPR